MTMFENNNVYSDRFWLNTKNINYTVDSIEFVNENWYIVKYKKADYKELVNDEYYINTFKAYKYILVGKNEMIRIVMFGIDEFLKNIMIDTFRSKKSLINNFNHEPFYNHIFKKETRKKRK